MIVFIDCLACGVMKIQLIEIDCIKLIGEDLAKHSRKGISTSYRLYTTHNQSIICENPRIQNSTISMQIRPTDNPP